MVDVLLIVRDDGTAAAHRLAQALRALVEQRLCAVPGLACAWGEAGVQERAYRDRVLEIELHGDGATAAPARGPAPSRVWHCGGDELGPLERIFEALVVDLRGCGLLSRGA